MASLERVLESGSSETPTCACGAEMELKATESHRNVFAETKVFECGCGKLMRLMVWKDSIEDGVIEA